MHTSKIFTHGKFSAQTLAANGTALKSGVLAEKQDRQLITANRERDVEEDMPQPSRCWEGVRIR